MALYEYVCMNKKCKHRMEKIIFSEDEEKALRCEKCNAKKLKKIMSVCSPPDVRGLNAANGYTRTKE